ncbi:MAG: hypothetical protein WBA10_04630, partial [Elainellaceae cyanobacterium]
MAIDSELTAPATPVLLVPQGAEYQAACRGTGQALPPTAIAMGQAAVAQVDALLGSPPKRAILLGLGGSLSPGLEPGDVVVCEGCVDQASGQQLGCDRDLCADLCQVLNAAPSGNRPLRVTAATGLTSDGVVCAAAEKRRLGERYG